MSKAVMLSEDSYRRIMRAVSKVEKLPSNLNRSHSAPILGGGGGKSLFIAKIMTRVSDDHYTCDIYGNGKHNEPTGLAKILRILEVADAAYITVGHFVLVTRQMWIHPITGEEEVEYTYDVPRNL